jgi:hypothetical protein
MSTLLPYDIVGQARRNREQGPQPGFGTKNKQKALADLIASMPADQQDLHVGERNRLHAATKKFNGHGAMRPDGASKWKLRGMKSSLHHFQVIGTSQMRDMEKTTNPSGGILGYEMGLGKTVMVGHHLHAKGIELTLPGHRQHYRRAAREWSTGQGHSHRCAGGFVKSVACGNTEARGREGREEYSDVPLVAELDRFGPHGHALAFRHRHHLVP